MKLSQRKVLVSWTFLTIRFRQISTLIIQWESTLSKVRTKTQVLKGTVYSTHEKKRRKQVVPEVWWNVVEISQIRIGLYELEVTHRCVYASLNRSKYPEVRKLSFNWPKMRKRSDQMTPESTISTSRAMVTVINTFRNNVMGNSGRIS